MDSKRLLVLGGGPGGYTAAFLAADRGFSVTLVDAGGKPGGVCLHRGCIPSKALLHAAGLIREARKAEEWGIRFGPPEIDLAKMRDWKNQLVSKMANNLATLAKKRGVRIVAGHGAFRSSNTLAVGDEILEFDSAIIATGSRPFIPGALRSDSPLVMDSTSALELESIPQRLLIVGGGYIGLEMGTFYSALGSRVTVVEMTDGLLPGVDRDLVRPLFLRLKRDFEAIHLNTRVTGLNAGAENVTVTLEGEAEPKEQVFDRVLVSAGRVPNTSGIGLEAVSISPDSRGFIGVGPSGMTENPAIYAIGDAVGGAMLAHKASHEAKVVVDALMGGAVPEPGLVPCVVFTDPEIAWVGVTETEAKAAGREYEVAAFPWAASGRAATLGRSDGLSKLVIELNTGRIVGVGITGPGAGELISEGTLAIQSRMTTKSLAHMIHPHPTLSETLMEAADLHLGLCSHIFKPK